MTMHLSAYRTNADLGGSNTSLIPVVDNSVATQSNLFVVIPSAVPYLLGEALFTGVETAFTLARIESPSLRTLVNQNIRTIGAIADDSKELRVQWHGMSPRQLVPGEGMEFVVNDDSAAAIEHHGLVWLGDGAVKPVSGNIFTVRCTSAVAAVNTGWTAGVITFTERVPFGVYDVVGMAAFGADGTAVRLIFPGQPFRPGVPMNQAESTDTNHLFRYGNVGVFGSFDLNQPPQVEVFGGASAAQTIYLDLIKRS